MNGEADAVRRSWPLLRKLGETVEALKPRNLRARFVALNAPQRTMVVLIVCLLAVVLTTFNRYGFSFDEGKGILRAKSVLAFFQSFGRVSNPSRIDTGHGTAPDLLAVLLQNLAPVLSVDARHLVFALFGVAGIYYLYRFGSRFVGEWGGVFAALFLAATPMWFGHMFFNAKDIPFATLLLASTYYVLVGLTEPALDRARLVKVGLAVGLLAGTKLGGVPALILAIGVFVAGLTALPRRNGVRLAPDLRRRLASLGIAALVGCLLGLLLFWPQLLTLQFAFREAGGNSVLKADQSPYYGATYFLVTTPVFLLGLGAVGTLLAVYRRQPVVIAAVIIVFSAFLAQALSGFRLNSGTRHFLFVYPFFMLTAAYPVAVLLETLRDAWPRRLLVGAIAFCLLSTAVEMYRLFPYQYSFYNSLAGGLTGADGVYEIDVWRTATREALGLVAAKVRPGDKVNIRFCASNLNLKGYQGLRYVERMEDADYFIALRRGKRCAPELFQTYPVVGEVRREGVLLARVYARR